jgi:hypothetical protein
MYKLHNKKLMVSMGFRLLYSDKTSARFKYSFGRKSINYVSPHCDKLSYKFITAWLVGMFYKLGEDSFGKRLREILGLHY